jgi:signal transduction histidine kinase
VRTPSPFAIDPIPLQPFAVSQLQNDSANRHTLPTERPNRLPFSRSLPQEQRILEVLSALSYRAGELDAYLSDIACGVSQLLNVEWAVVTLYQDGVEQVMASNRDLCTCSQLCALYGSLTRMVVQTGRSLTLEDAKTQLALSLDGAEYIAYLGVPLKTAHANRLGTICCFSDYPRQFTLEEIQTAELFAERAATAIDNYLLYQQQCQFNEILEAEVVKRTEELQRTQARLIERERLAAIGEFAAMIVHEIRNPMTTIRMGLDYFQRISQAEADRERAGLAIAEVNRLQKLLEEILLYAKPQMLEVTEFGIQELMDELLPSLREMPAARDRQIEGITATNLKLQGDRDKLKQVLINLIRNACEAIAPQETVTWRVSPDEQSGFVHLQIHNSGDPIPPEVLAKIGEPFYSTKPNGTGLGLAIVKRIVAAHSGVLSIQSDAETGTTVHVHLPVAIEDSHQLSFNHQLTAIS